VGACQETPTPGPICPDRNIRLPAKLDYRPGGQVNTGLYIGRSLEKPLTPSLFYRPGQADKSTPDQALYRGILWSYVRLQSTLNSLAGCWKDTQPIRDGRTGWHCATQGGIFLEETLPSTVGWSGLDSKFFPGGPQKEVTGPHPTRTRLFNYFNFCTLNSFWESCPQSLTFWTNPRNDISISISYPFTTTHINFCELSTM